MEKTHELRGIDVNNVTGLLASTPFSTRDIPLKLVINWLPDGAEVLANMIGVPRAESAMRDPINLVR